MIYGLDHYRPVGGTRPPEGATSVRACALRPADTRCGSSRSCVGADDADIGGGATKPIGCLSAYFPAKISRILPGILEQLPAMPWGVLFPRGANSSGALRCGFCRWPGAAGGARPLDAVLPMSKPAWPPFRRKAIEPRRP